MPRVDGRPRTVLTARERRLAGWLALAGAAAFVYGAAFGDAARAWQALLVNFLFFTGLAQAGVVLSALVQATSARWARPLKRAAEATAGFLPVSLLLLAVLLAGLPAWAPWAGAAGHARDGWLAAPWFAAREAAGFLLLAGVSAAYLYHSVRPDVGLLQELDGRPPAGFAARLIARWHGAALERDLCQRSQSRLAPVVLIAYGWVFSLVAFDFVMALDPPLVLRAGRGPLLHGQPAGRHRAAGAGRGLPRAARPRGPRRAAAAPRPRHPAVRLRDPVGLPALVAVPRDLVRRPAGGGGVRRPPARGRLGAAGVAGRRPDLRAAVRGPAQPAGEGLGPRPGRRRGGRPGRAVAGAVRPRGALAHARRRPAAGLPELLVTAGALGAFVLCYARVLETVPVLPISDPKLAPAAADDTAAPAAATRAARRQRVALKPATGGFPPGSRPRRRPRSHVQRRAAPANGRRGWRAACASRWASRNESRIESR